MKKEQKQSTTPAYCEWQHFEYEIRSGHFYCDEQEVDSVRAWLLSQGKHPRVMMKDALKTKSLMLHLGKKTVVALATFTVFQKKPLIYSSG